MRARHAKHDSFFAATLQNKPLDGGGGSRDHSAETRFAHDLHTYAFRLFADELPPDRYFQIASSQLTKLMKGMLS